MKEFELYGKQIRYDENLSYDEAKVYADMMLEKYHDKGIVTRVDISLDENNTEEVVCDIYFDPVQFTRLRRVTGYLAGDVRRFNDAKRAEEHDRVKHSITQSYVDEKEFTYNGNGIY